MPILQKRELSSYGGQYLIENERQRFELFRALLPYFKELESCIDSRNAALKRKSQAEGKLELPILTTLVSAVLFTITFAIPFVIVFYIATNVIKLEDGVSLFSVIDEWWETTALMALILDLSSGVSQMDSLLLQFLLGLLLTVSMLVIVPCVYFLLPIMLVLCTISTIFTRISAKKEIKEDIEICKEMELRIDELVVTILIPMQNVPYNYRTSEALEHFCNSYINGRASTVKEAIDAYDTYLHRKKVEHSQEVIHNDQNKILDELQYQQRKLSDLQDSIDRVKNRVDWL